jgi:hypothetical protein
MGNIAKGRTVEYNSRTDTKTLLVCCELFQKTEPIIALKAKKQQYEGLDMSFIFQKKTAKLPKSLISKTGRYFTICIYRS